MGLGATTTIKKNSVPRSIFKCQSLLGLFQHGGEKPILTAFLKNEIK